MLALLGLYSAALYADNTYGVLEPSVVQVDPGLFVLIFVGVPVKFAFAAASDHVPAATYVLGLLVGFGYNMDTNPEFASTIVPAL